MLLVLLSADALVALAVRTVFAAFPALRQREHEQLVAAARVQLGAQAREPECEARAARAHRDVLLAVDGIGRGITVHRCAQVDVPEHLARLLVVSAEVAVDVAAEQDAAAGRYERQHAGALLNLP